MTNVNFCLPLTLPMFLKTRYKERINAVFKIFLAGAVSYTN